MGRGPCSVGGLAVADPRVSEPVLLHGLLEGKALATDVTLKRHDAQVDSGTGEDEGGEQGRDIQIIITVIIITTSLRILIIMLLKNCS